MELPRKKKNCSPSNSEVTTKQISRLLNPTTSCFEMNIVLLFLLLSSSHVPPGGLAYRKGPKGALLTYVNIGRLEGPKIIGSAS
jgi:hypothetical protein